MGLETDLNPPVVTDSVGSGDENNEKHYRSSFKGTKLPTSL